MYVHTDAGNGRQQVKRNYYQREDGFLGRNEFEFYLWSLKPSRRIF